MIGMHRLVWNFSARNDLVSISPDPYFSEGVGGARLRSGVAHAAMLCGKHHNRVWHHAKIACVKF